jgi:hypothetical protein
VEGVKLTPSALEVKVTSPPPYVLNITAFLVVAMAVADSGVVGPTRIVVGLGTVEAWMALLRAELTEAALELDSDCELERAELCAGVLGVGVVEVVVALLPLCLLAIWTSLDATRGFSEWTCSMADRSLLKTPSLNLGDSECRAWWIASESMESRSLLNSSQSIMAPSCFDCFVAGDEKALRKRVLSTRAFRRPNMVEAEEVCKRFCVLGS